MPDPQSPTPRGSPPTVHRPVHHAPLLSIAALLLAGCGRDGAPTDPTAAIAPPEAPAAAVASAAPELAMSGLAIVNLGVDDAATRLLPALSDAVAAARLRGVLGELTAQLAAGNTAKARHSLGRARDAVRGGDASDAADLAAIDLVLDHAEALLGDDTEQSTP